MTEETNIASNQSTSNEEPVKNATPAAATPVSSAVTIQKQKQEFEAQAEKAAYATKLNSTQVITMAENTKNEWKALLMFPGTKIASKLRDECRNPESGFIQQSKFMDEVIKPKYGVVQAPSSIGQTDFWDTHAGYDEFFQQSLEFLAKGLN